MNEMLTAKQVQDILNIDRTTVYRMLKDGRLSGVKIGKHWRFLKDEIQSLLDLNENPASNAGLPSSLLPTPCIQSLQDVFGEIVRIGTLTVDNQGNPITQSSNSCAFCQMIQSTEKGMAACKQSWKLITKIKSSNMEFFTCHAGLSYTYVRIKVNNIKDTFLIAGQFFISESDKRKQSKRLDAIAHDLNLDLKALKQAENEIVILNEHIQTEINRWMAHIARTIVGITSERSRLILRLKKIAELSNIEI